MREDNRNFGRIGRPKEKYIVDLGNLLFVCLGALSIVMTGLYLKYKLKPATIVEHTRLLSITEVEKQYDIEVLMPIGIELQDWCIRRGANIRRDGIVGPNTIGAMDWVRSQQEASRHNYTVEKEFWR
jgi:hypothetical protein